MEIFIDILLRHPTWEIRVTSVSKPNAYCVEFFWTAPNKLAQTFHASVYLNVQKLRKVTSPGDWMERELAVLEKKLLKTISEYESPSP